MKNMFTVNRLLSALALMFFSMSAYGQQEPMYSQYMFNMLNINPAYAGSRGLFQPLRCTVING
jgi:hypothetical protein